ncbi:MULTISPECIES: helix-turn-helix domain-containing protein [Fructobacillus]|uniref:helix-turn-helix domain-containing protein n=1 Tax=Fructobacillus TaxID=559173 RepID=UPI00064DB29A|nr:MULTISPECIES: helix-turn-helix transcriptional regulator [Fructobacillus]KMK53169.1 HTH-type transcriptional regulator ImmR [Fructobacillus sp. EFB-N1]MCK8626701.1 helix-turn-helix domain-containing protein [Fructobacillus cardui]
MTLVSRTKETAKLRGLSLKTVATKAGLAENAIYRWNENNPKAENLQKVADVLNVSTDYLLGRTNQMNSYDSKDKTTDIADDTLIMAFDGKPIPDEEREKLLDYARYIMSQKKEK